MMQGMAFPRFQNPDVKCRWLETGAGAMPRAVC